MTSTVAPTPGDADTSDRDWPLEVELKLAAIDPTVLSHLGRMRQLGPGRLGDATVVSEVDRYVDTADGRLAAAGLACRLRSNGETMVVSLKGPVLEELEPAQLPPHGLQRRHELEGPTDGGDDPGAWPPSAASAVVAQLTGGAPLTDRFSLRQRRTQRPVHVGSQPIGTLSLDRVSVMRRGAVIGRFEEVELELAPDQLSSAPELGALSAALEAIPGLTVDRRSKLQRAEAMLEGADTPPADPPPTH